MSEFRMLHSLFYVAPTVPSAPKLTEDGIYDYISARINDRKLDACDIYCDLTTLYATKVIPVNQNNLLRYFRVGIETSFILHVSSAYLGEIFAQFATMQDQSAVEFAWLEQVPTEILYALTMKISTTTYMGPLIETVARILSRREIANTYIPAKLTGNPALDCSLLLACIISYQAAITIVPGAYSTAQTRLTNLLSDVDEFRPHYKWMYAALTCATHDYARFLPAKDNAAWLEFVNCQPIMMVLHANIVKQTAGDKCKTAAIVMLGEILLWCGQGMSAPNNGTPCKFYDMLCTLSSGESRALIHYILHVAPGWSAAERDMAMWILLTHARKYPACAFSFPVLLAVLSPANRCTLSRKQLIISTAKILRYVARSQMPWDSYYECLRAAKIAVDKPTPPGMSCLFMPDQLYSDGGTFKRAGLIADEARFSAINDTLLAAMPFEPNKSSTEFKLAAQIMLIRQADLTSLQALENQYRANCNQPASSSNDVPASYATTAPSKWGHIYQFIHDGCIDLYGSPISVKTVFESNLYRHYYREHYLLDRTMSQIYPGDFSDNPTIAAQLSS